MTRAKVAILYKYVPEYRFDFFTHLQDLCRQDDVDLRIIYGDPGGIDRTKGDARKLDRGTFVGNRFLRLGRSELIWQPVLDQVRGMDLIVAEQANKLLINPLLIGRQMLGGAKFAFWGHGRNLQATDRHRWSEWAKRRMIRLPHWWFTYTDGTARAIEAAGQPAARTTVLYNAIDTRKLVEFRRTVTQAELDEAAARIGLTSKNVCCYVGGMYDEKRIDFLLEACRRIRARVPDFQMILVGAGPDAIKAEAFARDNPWVLYRGGVYGAEKNKLMLLAKLMLMPGLVGLAVLDTFALGVPIVTTDVPFHSPEVEYIENGRNGVIVSPCDDVDRYAGTVVDLLADEPRRAGLQRECERSAQIYTVERMASQFLQGIKGALALS